MNAKATLFVTILKNISTFVDLKNGKEMDVRCLTWSDWNVKGEGFF